MGSYTNPVRKRKMETILPDAVKDDTSLDDIKKRAKLTESEDKDGDAKMK